MYPVPRARRDSVRILDLPGWFRALPLLVLFAAAGNAEPIEGPATLRELRVELFESERPTTIGLKGRVLVFNVDFIEENLRWKEGTANPVFYLGKAQVELAKKLEEVGTAMTALTLRREEAARRAAASVRGTLRTLT